MHSIFNIQKLFRISIFVFAASWLALPSAVSAATISASLKPAFQTDLTSTLKLQAGSGNPTFTRATTAYVQDFEGILRPVISGEARFQGARRVENLATVSETSSSNTAVTVTANALSKPLAGYASAALAVPTTASSMHRLIPGITRTLGVGSTVWYVAVVKAAGYSKVAIREQVTDGTEVAFDLSSGTILYESYTSATGGLATITSKGNGWYQIAVRKTNGANTGPFMNLVILPDSYTTGSVSGAWVPDGSSGIYVTGFQEEDQTGQANTNPSEYVSKGVLAAPYHGAGVDGVKYFNTLNGNTVTSNVVGEASGGRITSAQAAAAGGVTAGVVDASGPMGYLAEGARTNLALQSQTFGTTWTTSNSSVSADAVTAPDGLLTADRLIEDGTENVHWLLQTGIAGSPSTTYTYSVYVKPNGRSVLLGISSGSYGAQTAYNLTTNTVIAGYPVGTGAGTPFTNVSSTLTTLPNGWYRVTLTSTTIASSGTLAISVQGANPANPTPNVYTGDGASGLYVWGAQLEAGSFASSYIPTTTGSAARNADVLSYPTSRNISGSLGTAYAEPAASYTASAWPFTTVVQSIILGGNPGVIMYGHTSSLRFYDGTAERTLATFTPTTSLSRVAAVWGGNARSVLNGTVGTAQSFDGDIGLGSNLYIGSFTGGLYPWFGTIRGVKAWPKALTTTQLSTMTNTSTATSRAAIPQTSVKAPTGTGLVGHWTFNEGTGTKANDSSGSGNSGTLVGSPTWTIGKLGKALSLSGTGQYISVPDAAVLNPSSAITVSVWTHFASIGASSIGVVGKGETPAQSGYLLGKLGDGTKMRFYPIDVSSSYVESLTNIVANRWAHWTATYDGTTAKIYLNGVLDNSTSIAGSVGTNTQPVVIGRWYGNYNGYYFPGSIDDARIYNRALSAAEIAALYRSTATVINTSTNTVGGSLTSGLVGLWSFDGKDMNWGTGLALDRSGQGNNGSLVSMSTTTSPAIGKLGQALNFNGASYVSTSGSPTNGSASVFAWVNPYFLGTCPGASPNTCEIAMIAGNFLFEIGNGNVSVYGYAFNTPQWVTTSNAGIKINTWMHLGFTYDQTTLRVYLNGTQIGTANVPGVMGSGGGFSIGGGNNFRLFEGKIDDVRDYNRALSATEVKSLYNLGR